MKLNRVNGLRIIRTSLFIFIGIYLGSLNISLLQGAVIMAIIVFMMLYALYEDNMS